MAMTQGDIRAHYEVEWKRHSEHAASAGDLAYSSPVEDAVLYPAYEKLLADLGRAPEGRRVLDVGSGSGRWVRFFLSRFTPASLLGIDYAASSIDLLRRWWSIEGGGRVTPEFRHASITDPALNLGGVFDLINIANVLFHIPDESDFARAMDNLRRHVAPGGCVVTTEYLPRQSMRTDWMLVRSRYEFEAAAARAGFRVAAVRAFAFFANDPMGLESGNEELRGLFHTVRNRTQHLLASAKSPQTRQYLVELFAEIERAAVGFSRDRCCEADLPSQKLVVLTPA